MISSYDESYLSDVQKNLGFFFQFMLCNMNFSPEEAQKKFLESIIPVQIEMGNPDFLCGKSGLELAKICLGSADISDKVSESLSEPYYPQAEYWSGYVLAYCQWKNAITFAKILSNYSLELLLSNYNMMHEADISKINKLIMECVS